MPKFTSNSLLFAGIILVLLLINVIANIIVVLLFQFWLIHQKPFSYQYFIVFIAIMLAIGFLASLTYLILQYSRTKQKEADDRLKRWSQVFQHAQWGIFVISSDGKVLELMNNAFANMHGYTIDELNGKPVKTIQEPDFQYKMPDYIQQAYKYGHCRIEARHVHRSGKIFPVLVDISTVKNHEGEVQFLVVNVQDITEQKLTEQALRQSEMLLRRVLEVLPVGVCIADPQGTINYINQTAQKIWQGECYDKKLHFAKEWYQTPDDCVKTDKWPITRAILKGETTIGEQIEHTCCDGTFKIIQSSALPLYSETGASLGAIAVYEDVTQTHLAQEELRISRDFFKNAFLSSAVGMAIMDFDGHFLTINAALCRIFEMSEQELLQLSIGTLTHADDIKAATQRMEKVKSGALAFDQVEKRFVLRNGKTIWVLHSLASIQGKGGVTAYLVGQFVDMTARKLAESKLMESESNLEKAQEQSNLGSWHIDMLSGHISCSEENHRIFELPVGVIPDMTQIISFIHPDDRIHVRQQWNKALENGRLDIQHRLVRGGKLKWVRERADIEYDKSGRPVRITGTTQDITELKLKEEQLRHSELLLRELIAHRESIREEERTRIAHEIHDELGQLLTALKMDVSLLRMRFGENNKDLLKKLEHMRSLVETTISVVRNVASNLRPAALDLGIAPALEWLADNFSKSSGVSCVIDTYLDDIELNTEYATAIFRIVQESLTNVSRHAQAKKVEISLHCINNQLQLKISDDGIGFDPEKIEKQYQFGVFGMKERVRNLGGVFKFISTAGKGATTIVNIPLTHSHSIKSEELKNLYDENTHS